MLKGLKKHEDKEQGKVKKIRNEAMISKTKHEPPRSKDHKATQNKNNIRVTAIEWSVA